MNLHEFFPTLPLLPNAECRNIENPNIFFPESRWEERNSLPFVRSICAKCIERKECLEYALNEQIPHGIWGGKTPEERGFTASGKRRSAPRMNRAAKIRELAKLGHQPKEIASIMNIETAYVTMVLKRSNDVKLEGEIQSQLKTNDSFAESQSSSVSQ